VRTQIINEILMIQQVSATFIFDFWIGVDLSLLLGGVAMVFRHLDKVQPGSRLFLTSAGRVHEYIVTRVHVIEEQDASPRQQNTNLAYIEPTTHEVVTLLSCWPPTGPRQYSQRIIVQAVPYVISTAY
jgi:LPXTG-site transpeptidase (sortase) family protein